MSAESPPRKPGTAFSAIFREISDSSTSRLLGLLSLCEGNQIPRDLFELDGHELSASEAPWADFCNGDAELGKVLYNLLHEELIETENDGEYISINRQTQESFIHDEYGLRNGTDLQKAFDSLVALLSRRMPTQDRDKTPHGGDQAKCGRYAAHISSLADIFRSSLKAQPPSQPIAPSEKFVELLKSAAWYLQEIGELKESAALLALVRSLSVLPH